MKKAIIFLALICVFFFIKANTNINNIKEALIERADNGAVTLSLKSDYKDNIQMTRENQNSVYFDIKNAGLSDSYKTSFNPELSVVTQQIGKKVRIYLKGENLENTKAVFFGTNRNKPVNYNMLSLITGLLALMLVIAQKSYSATINLRTRRNLTETPAMKTAMNLNRQLYQTRKRPEIVLNQNYTDPIQTEVYDFRFAKNKKNTKIAI